MDARGTSTSLCRIVAVIEEVHWLATGTALSEDTARQYFRDPKALARVFERSGTLDSPSKRDAFEQLLEKETPHGV
jgi:uncharacterized protein (DUF2236 family)